MDNARLLPVAIANLRTSQAFLEKLLSLCDRVAVKTDGSGTGHRADEQTIQAVALLARMNDAVLLQIDHCQRHGGSFSAHQVLAAVLGSDAALSPQEDEGAEIRRMRVIMDMCLQQSDVYRRKTFFLSEKLERLRAVVKDVYAELAAARHMIGK